MNLGLVPKIHANNTSTTKQQTTQQTTQHTTHSTQHWQHTTPPTNLNYKSQILKQSRNRDSPEKFR
jgi:hypothetical protein